jgi:predicted dehydrogenase
VSEQRKQYGVGIVGLDHWYAGIGAADALRNNPRARVVAVAHRDEAKLREFAAERGIPFTTTDYRAIAPRDDVDVVVTACPTAENVEICIDAARRGKHIVSVKPFAMTLADGDRLAGEVQRAGVRFFSFDCLQRLGGLQRQFKEWIAQGRIGKPISATAIQRTTLDGASMDWPGRRNDKTWWRDPSKVPGGGWLDHAIYQVDQLRWILNDEVVKVTGVAKTLAHPELPKELEDFGVALLEFGGGAVATVEVTWTARSGAGLSLLQYVGTEGQIVHDQTLTGKVSVVGNFETPAGGGWTTFPAPARRGANAVDHLIECIESGREPAATIEDSRRNLAVCLAFYEAARTGKAVTL